MLHIRQTGLLLGVCSSPPLIIKRTSSSPVGSWPNWTGLKPGLLGRLNHLHVVWLNSKRSSACVSAVCFPNLTAELPPIVLYSSLPLRKLLQCLWMLCNDECVFVDAGLCQIQHPPEQPLILLFLFVFVFFNLLFAAQSRSVSDVRH